MATVTKLATVNTVKPVKTRATMIPAKRATTRQRGALLSACGIGAVAVGATALSLSDLAETVAEVAHVAVWKSYALAVALDANFICTEAFTLFATAAVARETKRATTATKIITLGMSAAANAYSMSHGADNAVMAGAGILFGVAIPALLALATYTLGKAAR